MRLINTFCLIIVEFLLSATLLPVSGQTYENMRANYSYDLGSGTNKRSGIARVVPKTRYLSEVSHVVNGRTVFLADAGTEYVIFSTDGTHEGTEQLISREDADLPEIGVGDDSQYKDAGFFSVANSGKLLYFYLKERGKNIHSLWRSDGTKEGTYKLPINVKSETTIKAYKSSLTGDYFGFIKEENGEYVNYFTDGTKESIKAFKKNISAGLTISNNSKYLFYQDYTRDSENKVVYSPIVKLYDPSSGEEKEIIFDDIDANSTELIQADDKKAYLRVLTRTSPKRQLWEIDMQTFAKRKLWESENVSLSSSNGRDSAYWLITKNDDVFFTVSNYKTGGATTSLWSYRNGASAKIADIDGYILKKIIFQNNLFLNIGTKLYISDGTVNGTRVLADYPLSRNYYDETGGRYVEPPGFQVIKNKLIYFIRTSNQSTRGNDYTIYQIDATTLKPSVFMNNIRGFSSFFEIGDKYYFTDHEYIYESDGTAAGSKKILTLPGHFDRKFDLNLNSTMWRDKVIINKISALNGKLMFEQKWTAAILSNISYASVIPGNSYNKAYNFAPWQGSGTDIYMFSFDPAASPKTCESGIYARTVCTDDPANVIFLQYPQSEIVWYKNNVLIPNTSDRDSILINESSAYKLQVRYKDCVSYSSELKLKVDAPKVTLTKGTEQSNSKVFFIEVTDGYKTSGGMYKKHEIIYNNKVVQSSVNFNNYYNIGSSQGNYTVRVTDDKGCIGESNIKMGEASGLIATISTSGDPMSSTPVTLYANNGAGYTYQWKKSGVDIPGATKDTYVATESGAYTVTITAAGQTATSSVVVVTITGSTHTATISSSSTTAYAPNTITLSANTGSGYTYQWKKDGVNIAGATNATYEVVQSGLYTVTITVGGRAVTSSSLKITINIPLAVEREITGIEVAAFPNPVESYLTTDVKLVRKASVKLELYTLDGRLVDSWKSINEDFVHTYLFELKPSLSGQQLILKVSDGKEFTTKKIILK